MPTDDRDELKGGIGDRVRQRRHERRLTLDQLAEKSGLSKSFLSELEAGRTDASGLNYLKLAQALDVDVQWLLTGREPEEGVLHARGIPPLVSKIAEERGWTHQFTVDVAGMLNWVVVRRTRGGHPWEPTRENILKIAEGIRERASKS